MVGVVFCCCGEYVDGLYYLNSCDLMFSLFKKSRKIGFVLILGEFFGLKSLVVGYIFFKFFNLWYGYFWFMVIFVMVVRFVFRLYFV